MKLYAINLDGPIADVDLDLFVRADKEFPELDLQYEADWEQKLYDHNPTAFDEFMIDTAMDESFCVTMTARTDVIREMMNWSFAGVVTSVVTTRPNSWRISTELWLAQNLVPYSNLLFNFNVQNSALFLGAVDASFYVETDPTQALIAASYDIPTYLLRTVLNQKAIELLLDENNFGVENLHIVTYMDEIAEREGIRVHG